MSRSNPPGIEPRADWILWFGAAIWGLHPLRVKPVAWVTGSTYPLSAFWLLLSFLLYLRVHRTPVVKFSTGLVASWIAAVIAYMTYPVTVTFGLFLLVVDGCFLRCVPPWRTRAFTWWFFKISAFLVPAIGVMVVTLYSRFGDTGIFSMAPDLESVGAGVRALTFMALLGALWGRLIWFVNLTPNVPPIEMTALNLEGIVGLALIVLLVTIWTWRNWRDRPGWATVWFGALALGIPCLGLTERPTWPVDRYSYIFHLVVIAGLSLGLISLSSRRVSYWVGVGGAIFSLGVCVVVSLRQLPKWSNSRALFSSMTQHPDFGSQPKQDGHILMMWSFYEAEVLNVPRVNELRARAFQTYRAEIRKALRIDDYSSALIMMNQIQRHFPTTAEMHREKGAWLIGLGRNQEAKFELRNALMMDPNDVRTRDLMAILADSTEM